ncbi:hypothetical protein TPA0598_05_03470 [Streptomyces lydicamycinicus]|uniref:Uncharacterized protein n=1 Tax=Streptomyces lydicamycinicus TaxID=1546107 RepID=A0A0P4RAK9_9ACTN|nr:hypothetical protein TPA0598_05_03470 [Streptomyces lydicamycinicus]
MTAGSGHVRGQAAELVPELLPVDEAAAGAEDLLSELPDEELDESEEDVVPDVEALLAGLLLDDEPRLSLR